ncbi:MAG TPA: serine/threonine protein kinase, partial [Planctomycetaceae bacterium]|nr:serine/threonine protein kinase [Planctomycetaceae bacterium]
MAAQAGRLVGVPVVPRPSRRSRICSREWRAGSHVPANVGSVPFLGLRPAGTIAFWKEKSGSLNAPPDKPNQPHGGPPPLDADDPRSNGVAMPRSQTGEPASQSVSGAGTTDLTDTMLGEFRLLRRLGRGGMAEVYLAEQTSLKRFVAIKVMRADFVTEDVYQKRFEREALAAAALNHPNIVQVYAIGEANGVRYIAQEYVHGVNLRQFLNRKGPPALPIALRIMKQGAMALHAAGKAGIVHRDIKPENILITRQGQVKVADFGLAQVTRREDPMHLTRSGSTVGTPLYMSPEQ